MVKVYYKWILRPCLNLKILKDLKANISPIDVIKKDAFGGTYFRDIYSNVNNKFYKNAWKEFKELKDIDKKILLLRFL